MEEVGKLQDQFRRFNDPHARSSGKIEWRKWRGQIINSNLIKFHRTK